MSNVKSKLLLLGLTAAIVVVVILVGATTLLAESHPFQPGDPLYALQYVAESIQLELTRDDTRRAEFAIELANRRLDEVAAAAGTDHLWPAAEYLIES